MFLDEIAFLLEIVVKVHGFAAVITQNWTKRKKNATKTIYHNSVCPTFVHADKTSHLISCSEGLNFGHDYRTHRSNFPLMKYMLGMFLKKY